LPDTKVSSSNCLYPVQSKHVNSRLDAQSFSVDDPVEPVVFGMITALSQCRNRQKPPGGTTWESPRYSVGRFAYCGYDGHRSMQRCPSTWAHVRPSISGPRRAPPNCKVRSRLTKPAPNSSA